MKIPPIIKTETGNLWAQRTRGAWHRVAHHVEGGSVITRCSMEFAPAKMRPGDAEHDACAECLEIRHRGDE